MELIDIIDENNNDLGYYIDRKTAHEQNLWHRHVSCWIMNFKGEVLMQKRSLTKKKNPGLWSKTGGHVDKGETPEQAIQREVYEEVGLKVKEDQIKNIEIFKSKNINEKYYSYGYIFFTNLNENEFILQKEEVCEVKYFKIEELEQAKKNNDTSFTFYKWDEEGFNNQMNILKENRKKLIEN